MTLVRRAKNAEAAIAAQIRGARAMLSWSQTELAVRSGIAPRTLADLETGRRYPRHGTVDRLVAVLAQAGIEISESDDRVIVSMKLSEDGMPTSRV